ncbi:MAG: DUF3298 and DUF4163 domain-containing protein [Bacteroides sp.]|nr:DUF3298 and DUF4163 domain-containing protein [Roseburia sp.]MCM1346714.1 DUF3298 and DUF4163 domain-containing protein [Bacteroides sp.]MCM1421461.1 DUF3298 and DUF4163 domain-containing protein [Bacteroides sp.]
MRQYVSVCAVAAIAVAAVSCGNIKSDGIVFDTIAISDGYKLDEGTDGKPLGYEIMTDVMFLQAEDEEKKDICDKINKSVIEELMHREDSGVPEAAIRKYIEENVDEYKTDVADLYKMERQKNQGNENETSYASFNHYTHLKGVASRGFEGIINYTMTEDSYSGGAHPVSYTTKMCFSVENGERVHLEDVFCEDSTGRLVKMLTEQLMRTKGAETKKELKKRGYLNFTEMFVSENFSLEPDSVVFFYNEYDIAPYSEGPTTLSLSYKDMKGLLR